MAMSMGASGGRSSSIYALKLENPWVDILFKFLSGSFFEYYALRLLLKRDPGDPRAGSDNPAGHAP